jgi:hypothetical protein
MPILSSSSRTSCMAPPPIPSIRDGRISPGRITPEDWQDRPVAITSSTISSGFPLVFAEILSYFSGIT